MKKINVKSLSESSNLSAVEKMRLFDIGQRRENVKACSDQKLRDYLEICRDNNFKNAGLKIIEELVNRGLMGTKEIRLDNITLEESDFTDHFAKEVYEDVDSLIVDLTNIIANKDPMIDLYNLNDKQKTQLMVDYVLYLIWAVVLKVDKSKINKLLQLCINLPIAKVDEPQIKNCIKQVLSKKTIIETLNKIANQLVIKESLSEDIEKHDQLNPKLWDEDKVLRDEVREKILEIADKFLEQLKEDEIKIEVEDIKLVGSNCSYNYTKDSDLDIHIVANTEKLGSEANLYPIIYDKYKSLFNDKYDIDFYGIPVEIYVETSDTKLEEERKPSALKSNGIYSVMNNKWIKEPILEDIPDINEEEIEEEFNNWVDKANKVIESQQIEEIEKFFEELYEMRRESIANDGEYGIGNLVFKELRNNSYLDGLKELKNELVSADLSLTEQ